jgi:hypothetical protein
MRRRFPRHVYYGFRPDGSCVTLGYPNRAGAWLSMMFTFAGEVVGKSHVTSPRDDDAARKAGWNVARKR